MVKFTKINKPFWVRPSVRYPPKELRNEQRRNLTWGRWWLMGGASMQASSGVRMTLSFSEVLPGPLYWQIANLPTIHVQSVSHTTTFNIAAAPYLWWRALWRRWLASPPLHRISMISHVERDSRMSCICNITTGCNSGAIRNNKGVWFHFYSPLKISDSIPKLSAFANDFQRFACDVTNVVNKKDVLADLYRDTVTFQAKVWSSSHSQRHGNRQRNASWIRIYK